MVVASVMSPGTLKTVWASMFVAAVPLNNFRKGKVSAMKCKLGAVELESLVETQTTVWVVHGCATADGVHAGKCRRESVHLCSVEDALIRGWHLGALVETPEPKV